jgi:hypothetical protein
MHLTTLAICILASATLALSAPPTPSPPTLAAPNPPPNPIGHALKDPKNSNAAPCQPPSQPDRKVQAYPAKRPGMLAPRHQERGESPFEMIELHRKIEEYVETHGLGA